MYFRDSAVEINVLAIKDVTYRQNWKAVYANHIMSTVSIHTWVTVKHQESGHVCVKNRDGYYLDFIQCKTGTFETILVEKHWSNQFLKKMKKLANFFPKNI